MRTMAAHAATANAYDSVVVAYYNNYNPTFMVLSSWPKPLQEFSRFIW